MARKNNSTINLLILAPWWISVLLAPIAYITLSAVIPGLVASSPPLRIVGMLAQGLAPYAAGLLCFFAAVSALRRWKIGGQLEAQDSIDSLLKLHWKEFEDLAGEAFRRQGYRVTERLGGGADGGIDLKLVRDGEVTLVQCKRWKGRPVPVQIVRELYGVMRHENACRAKLVATTRLTSEAIAFAAGKPIDLIDSEALLQLLRGVQVSEKRLPPESEDRDQTFSPPVSLTGPGGQPQCERCSSSMVLRTAKRGANEGKQFWGCSNYPRCKETRAA